MKITKGVVANHKNLSRGKLKFTVIKTIANNNPSTIVTTNIAKQALKTLFKLQLNRKSDIVDHYILVNNERYRPRDVAAFRLKYITN